MFLSAPDTFQEATTKHKDSQPGQRDEYVSVEPDREREIGLTGGFPELDCPTCRAGSRAPPQLLLLSFHQQHLDCTVDVRVFS